MDTASTTWRYLDTNNDPAAGNTDRTVWTQEAFDDSTWKSGKGGFGSRNGSPTGIGGGNTVTTLLRHFVDGSSAPVVPAYFFRTTFTLESGTLDEITGLKGQIVYDDSATIYVNGQRVVGWGDSMITQNLSYQNKNGATDPAKADFFVPAEMLMAGENTLAVEIHQCNDTSSDVYFSLTSLETTDTISVPFPQDVLDRTYASDTPPATPTGGDYFTFMLGGFADLRTHHPEILSANEIGSALSANDRTAVATNNRYAAVNDPQVQKALADGAGSAYLTMADSLGSRLGPIYTTAMNAGDLPKTKALLSGRVEESVGNHEPAKAAYSYKRPFVRLGFQSDGGLIKKWDSSGGYAGLYGNGSFPSGHANHGYSQGTTLATLLPELAPQILARSSEYGDNRIVLGFHYPLDVMGGRMVGQNITQMRWSDPQFRTLLEQARHELRTVLERECGAQLQSCIANQSPYLTTKGALEVYRERLTYGFVQVGHAGAPASVPAGAEDLLLTTFRELTDAQRRLVLEVTSLDSGYPLDEDDGSGSWQRLDLAAAMAAEVVVEADGSLTINGERTGEPVMLAVTTTTVGWCNQSSGYFSVRVVNNEEVPLDVQLVTPFGTKSFAGVATGKAAYQAFSTRGAFQGDATADIVVRASDGRHLATSSTSSISCG